MNVFDRYKDLITIVSKYNINVCISRKKVFPILGSDGIFVNSFHANGNCITGIEHDSKVFLSVVCRLASCSRSRSINKEQKQNYITRTLS